MKKSLLVISMMLVFAIALVGCATTGDLEKVQAQGQQTFSPVPVFQHFRFVPACPDDGRHALSPAKTKLSTRIKV